MDTPDDGTKFLASAMAKAFMDRVTKQLKLAHKKSGDDLLDLVRQAGDRLDAMAITDWNVDPTEALAEARVRQALCIDLAAIAIELGCRAATCEEQLRQWAIDQTSEP